MGKYGYIYKTTNMLTGEYYIGKRTYEKDENSIDYYLGSGKALIENVRVYGRENFKRDIICECATSEELFDAESKYIRSCYQDPLCLNSIHGDRFGGVYDIGTCPNCGSNTVIYKNSGLCMRCIVGNHEKKYCPKCNRITYHYSTGKCMSCVSKEAHSHKWCDFCQAETAHFGDKCKHHNLYLVKNGDKIELHAGKEGRKGGRVLIKDVETLINTTSKIELTNSVEYNIEKSGIQIKCGDSFTALKNVIVNRHVKNWLRIDYRYDGRKDHVRSITLTTDHPLPLIDGTVKRADELVVGDRLIRVNIQKIGSGMQWEFGEIINIEKVDRECSSYDVTTGTEYFNVNNDILSHNCRSFLTVDRFSETLGNLGNAKNFVPGKHVYYSRFNQGVVTLNLVDVACSSGKNIDDFWRVFDERLELCHRALRCRHEHLLGTKSDVAPILWQHGALARLKKGETIDKLLYNGYSTISLGYAGLYECVKYMTGKSHTDPDVKDFALSIMQHMNDKCNEWKAAENIDYSVYGTPIESVTYKFAKCLRERFGVIKDVTDHDYITNSYHVNVREQIDAFKKLAIEAEFQKLSPGGAISYVETANLQGNIDAVLAIMQFIYDHIMYAELNTKSDYCQKCGYEGEIEVKGKAGSLYWQCPNCGNTDQSTMNVVRRTCGYIGSHYWNQGRTEEIRDRVIHTSQPVIENGL